VEAKIKPTADCGNSCFGSIHGGFGHLYRKRRAATPVREPGCSPLYLVSNAIILPVGAWTSNVIGGNFFLLCITIFTVASFLCGIAPSMPILVSVFGRHHLSTPRFRKRHPLIL
jgi:hypothetical protein